MKRTLSTQIKQAPGSRGKRTTRSQAKRAAVTRIKRTVGSQVQNERLVSERREDIIRAAIIVFHRLGFHVATTADIAKEAGLTQSNLYNYVNSKQDVLFLVCVHLTGLYDRSLDEVIERYHDSYSRLVESLKAITNVIITYSDEVQLLYNETHALDKRDRKAILELVSTFISRLQALLTEYEKEYGPIRFKNKRLAANLLSFVPAIVSLRRWDLASDDVDDTVQSISDFVLSGLKIPNHSKEVVKP